MGPKLTQEYNSVKFQSANKALERIRKRISRKFVGTYGIHSVGVSNPNNIIKVFVHKISAVPFKVKFTISKIARNTHVNYVESKVKHPEDYHLEEVFEK